MTRRDSPRLMTEPLAAVEHPGGVGVANELFELALDSFIVSARLF